MKRNFEIGELDRAILHHGLCLLGGEARKQDDKRMLERVEALRMLLYPELEGQANKREEPPAAPSTPPAAPARDFQQTPYTPTLPPQQNYQPPPTPPPRRPASGGTPLISEKQSKRLYAIQMKSGKKTFQVNEYLKRQYGIASSREITVDIYDAIINWLQS